MEVFFLLEYELHTLIFSYKIFLPIISYASLYRVLIFVMLYSPAALTRSQPSSSTSGDPGFGTVGSSVVSFTLPKSRFVSRWNIVINQVWLYWITEGQLDCLEHGSHNSSLWQTLWADLSSTPSARPLVEEKCEYKCKHYDIVPVLNYAH